ncbi:hypothetical protein A5892_15115 [Halotalea alkalilenta]|uniref:Uncharacterized protein n=1 Tax=Halotalea alkalilenta TaxID=376489 RepID=A0A172YHE3_9GAMM|nr:hypothetical protein A5892_15115 [Halotalea alkalilenta]
MRRAAGCLTRDAAHYSRLVPAWQALAESHEACSGAHRIHGTSQREALPWLFSSPLTDPGCEKKLLATLPNRLARQAGTHTSIVKTSPVKRRLPPLG